MHFFYLSRSPNPRSAPSHASPVIFLCRYGRLSHLNVEKLNQELEHGIEMAIGTSQNDLALTPRHLRIIDQNFTDHLVGDENFRIIMRVAGDGLVVELQWMDTSAGESIEDLRRPDSIFRPIVNTIDRDRQFISFNVWSDSFETYLKARQIGDDHKVAAGWITFDRDDEYRSRLFTRSSHRPEYIVD